MPFEPSSGIKKWSLIGLVVLALLGYSWVWPWHAFATFVMCVAVGWAMRIK